MKKILINILMIVACVCLLTACGSKTNTNEEVANNTTTENKTTDQTTDDLADAYKVAYEAYIKGIEESSEDTSNYTYALIDVDDDGTPELFVNTNVDATGTKIVSMHNGTGTDVQLASSVEYIEKSGLIKSYGGSMDNYTIEIYKLENGEFTKVFSGTESLSDEARKAAEESGTYEWTYAIDSQEVSEEEFNSQMTGIFEIGSGVTPEATYTGEEMIALLNK